MKKITILLLLTASFAKTNAQQWTTSGTNIYNSNSGRVGIGTANPLSTLTVQSPVPSASVVYPLSVASLAPDAASGAGVGISFFTGGNSTESQRGEQARITVKQNYYGVRPSFTISTTDYNSPYTQFIDRFTIDPMGNLGVGTSAPGAQLDIKSGSTFPFLSLTTNRPYGSSRSWGFNTNYVAEGDFVLFQSTSNTNAPSVNRFMIDINGNVGIGATTFTEKLTVSGGGIALDADQPLRGGGKWLISGNASGVTVGTANLGFNLRFDAGSANRMLINGTTGYVGIGTTSPDFPLTVNGSIHAKEVRVDLNVPAPDYVFEKDYKLTSLEDIKTYIDQNKHLPEVPSAKEIEKNGVQLGEMNMILLKKIEELTLYVIALKRENEAQNQVIDELKKQK